MRGVVRLVPCGWASWGVRWADRRPTTYGARMVEKAVTSDSDAPVLLPGPRVEPASDPDLRLEPFDPRVEHRIVLVERHAFSVATCTGCGWESYARRSRPLARREGRDHLLLYGS